MKYSSVTTKGQVVIPSKLRNKYGIKTGTKIQFVEEDGSIKLIPLTPEIVDKNIGTFRTKGKLLKALMKEKQLERER